MPDITQDLTNLSLRGSKATVAIRIPCLQRDTENAELGERIATPVCALARNDRLDGAVYRREQILYREITGGSVTRPLQIVSKSKKSC